MFERLKIEAQDREWRWSYYKSQPLPTS